MFFRKQAAGANWETVTRSTANATELITVTAIPVNQWNIFRIEVENVSTVARFYINGSLVATHTGTTIPASGIRFGHQIGMLVTAATANSMDIDFVHFWSDDPATVGKSVIQKNTTPPPSVVEAPQTDFSGNSILPTFINTSKQYLSDISFVLGKMGTTDTGAIARAFNIQDDGTTTIDQYGSYFLNSFKQSIEKLSGVRIDTFLDIRSLHSDALDAGKISTDELCIGNICLSSGSLQHLLDGTNSLG